MPIPPLDTAAIAGLSGAAEQGRAAAAAGFDAAVALIDHALSRPR